jgi:hypothetical protein
MEQLPIAQAPATQPPQAATSGAAGCAAPAPAGQPPRKLDLTGMAPPGDLRAVRLEEFTIDGICGVY